MSSRVTEVLQGREHNYILPFLWQHGEEEAVIREEMARVHESGIGAVCIEARPHPDFLGPKWWLDMDIIMDEARKRGMKVWLLDDDHFPTGHAAGKVKEAPEELHRSFLGERYIDTIGPAQGTSLLVDTLLMTGLRPTISLKDNASGKNKLVSVTAVRRDPSSGALLGESVDLTELVHEGVLYWDIPEGYWRVFVISEDKQGGSEKQENYLNPLDRNSVSILLDTVYEAVYDRYKADFGHTFAGFFSDEPGFYNDTTTFDFNSRPGKAGVSLPWSSEMPVLLEQALGGDYRKHLPLLWHDTGEQSDLIRYTYMNIVSKLYAENFCNQIGEWCRARGVEYIGHVLEDNNVHARLGSGAGHFFRSLWGQDMSGLDVVLWQIVPGFDQLSFRQPTGGETDSEFYHYGLAKLGVSLGHIDPKKQGRTMCEVYGAYGWAEGLKLMKWLTDHMLVRGVNHFVPHAFTQKGFPDPDCPPHMYAGGKNPQYRYYGYLNRYINRISHLISGGRHVATAAVLYHAEAEWSGESMYFHKPVKALMQHQIDCEVLPVDILLEAASVKDNKLQVNREDYSCLIVPYAEALPAATLQRLLQFAEQGLPVRFVNGLPKRSSEGIDVSGALLSLSVHPNVKTSGLDRLAQDLTADGYYEVKVDGYEPHLRNYHYVHEDAEVFMFFNESPNQIITTKVALPLEGDVYAYDAFLNRVTRKETIGESGAEVVELMLHPYESVLLLHGTALTDYPAGLQWIADGIGLELKGEWTVSIADADHYPNFEARGQLTSLKNMSGRDVLPGFSGTFRYETEFEWNHSCDKVLLDLGEVYETAEVWINGQHAGLNLCPPYRMEVTGTIRKGTNRLVIEVTNTLAKDQRDFLSSFSQQEPSGLIGPVIITPVSGS
ncbi:glycosylhydrolase-like jelly roll fold domain-containing protein [Paenibacillus riograndensis]|uniref:Glycoside hydrolase family 2 protein n=1 Tax=Paenibacillus riograndensis SBR5 TaxID=1073571 RepID=A0A0E4HH10_9BACL|nr:glycosylhydrolase-like jelly roll fold domain-containing protein [Paenibacillus riograndensis]CQR57815.1 glycoside hydrolase family 2 protein [Paenibacillus riograndensis SBR5]